MIHFSMGIGFELKEAAKEWSKRQSIQNTNECTWQKLQWGIAKGRTPEGTEMGDNAVVSGGENLGKNHNGETVHLVGVSGKGDNNT